MGDDKTTVFLRLRNRAYIKPYGKILLGDIAQIIAPDKYEKMLRELKIYQAKEEDRHLIVIDFMQIIRVISNKFPEMNIKTVGNPEIIIEIITKDLIKKPKLLAVIFVWILLFIGSGLAIMNFHQDVSMQEVHQRLYYLITGIEKKRPLILQIPYSFGIGTGMVLFFNHVFKKKINEEPSPLEVEMFLYQKNLDQYVFQNENQENRNRP